jgi:hypothetical protein
VSAGRPRLQRRRLLVAGALAAGQAPLLVACQSAPALSGGPRALSFGNLDQARGELLRTIDERRLPPPGGWNAAQVMVHLAQSIEHSMTGYPQPRSRLFQATLGAAAFAVFDARGRMTHGLDEPIPGAAPLDGVADPAAAQLRLLKAIDAFQRWPGPLQPHFAYGELPRPAYERAHALHLADHLSAWVRTA